jgi:hypothetical protein
METKFKALLKYLSDDLSKEGKKEAILEYFGDEDREEFEIEDKNYYVFDVQEVKNLLKEQYTKECADFVKASYSINRAIVELIDFESVVFDMVDFFEYDSLEDYLFLDQVGDFYIYED